MEITCPKCAYTRIISEDKIPATAEVATCPKCKARFKFRDVKGLAAASDFSEPSRPVQRPVPPSYPQEEPMRSREPRDQRPESIPKPVETNAAPPEAPSEEIQDLSYGRHEEEPEQIPPAPQQSERPQSDSTGKDDFWDKLENIGASQDARDRHADFSKGAIRSEVPWEELENHGFFQGMFMTIKQVMFSPIDFFSSMPIRGGIGRPLVFYLLISEVVAVFAFIFQMMGMAALTTMGTAENAVDGMGLFAAAGVGGSALVLILYPILFTIGLFINAAISHFFLMIFKAADSGFEATFRVSAYGNAPIILAIIPLVGPIVGTLWTLFVLIIGFKYVHRAGYGQVIMAFLTPLLLLFALVVVAAMAIPFMAQS